MFFVDTVDTKIKAYEVHPVFEMFHSKERENRESRLDSKQFLSRLSIRGSSGIDVVLVKTESKERDYVNTVDTCISLI